MKKILLFLVTFVAALTLVGCTTEAEESEAAADVESALTSLILTNIDEVAGDFELYTTLKNDVVCTWTSSNTDVITIEILDGVTSALVVQPDEETVVTLTATLFKDGESATKTFDVTVTAKIVMAAQTVKEVREELADDEAVYLEGVTVVAAMDGKGSYVADSTGLIYVFGFYSVATGTVINLTGEKSTFYGSPQIQNASYTSSTAAVTTVTPTAITVAEFAALDSDLVASYGYYAVTGTVVEDSGTYYIQDADGNEIVIYYGSPSDSLDVLENGDYVGKTVTINVLSYNYHSTDLIWRVFFAGTESDITVVA